jgi:hypothetical protein
MKIQVSYTIELDDDETAESLTKRCRDMDCPCEEILFTQGKCPLGCLEVTGLCRLTSSAEWECCLQDRKHTAFF